MKRPDSYLAEYMHKKHFALTMRSHLIPYDKDSGLWTTGVKKAYSQFRRRRLRRDLSCFRERGGTQALP